jgi:hypothetical protein
MASLLEHFYKYEEESYIKVDWLKHRIQPVFLIKMPDKEEPIDTISQIKLKNYWHKTLKEMKA